MAGPARWYLAALGVLALLLLAAHFSVQEHVQKTMRLAVHDWLKQSGGDVQHVRYRLLRGALSMEQLTWVDPADPGLRLDVARVFVRTSSRALLNSTPSLSQLRFEQPVLSLRRSILLGWLRGDRESAVSSLSGLLQYAQAVTVEDMSLLVTTEQDARIDGLLLQRLSGQVSRHGLRLQGDLDAGTMQLQTAVDDTGGLSGLLTLRGISMASLNALSGSRDAPSGHVASLPDATASGELALSGDWKNHHVDMQGSLRLKDASGVGSLAVQGGWTATGIDVDLNCERVSLPVLPFVWPEFAGRRLEAGHFSGGMHVDRHRTAPGEQKAAGWRIVMNGDLSAVQLHAGQLPAWRIGSIGLSKAVLSGADGGFTAAAMQFADADIGLHAFTDASAVQQQQALHIESLKFEGIRLQLLFADGSVIALPELQGSGRLASGLPESSGSGHLTLASSGEDSDLAGGGEGETWKIATQGDLFAIWQARVKGVHVPVVRLRPFLPHVSLPGEHGVPEYSGHAGFELQLRPTAEGLQLDGHLALQDLRMMQGGDQFTAARIDVDIAEAGSDGRRRLSRVELADWHYQMALRPMPRISALPQGIPAADLPAGGARPESDAQASAQRSGDIVDVSESTAPMRAFNWEVEEMIAQQGRISLGQPDALIAGGVLLRIHHLASGMPAPFTLSGEFSGGAMQARGKLALQPGLLLDAGLEISNALPFAFNDWMRLSGMPRFVRGRMDARLNITQDGPALTGAYAGKLSLSLHQAALEAGAFPDDPMLQRSAYSSQGLLERINASRRFKLTIPFHGAWPSSNLAGNLGEAGLAVLKKAAGREPAATGKADPPFASIVRLRLQGMRGFSHNERVRLRQMAKVLLDDPELIVELVPQLGTAQADADMISRVRRSQRLVEDYLHKFGVAGKRIFPVWPQARHRHGDAPGLLLQARAP